MHGRPRASVVIPASRPTRLAFALEALAAQELEPEAFEVLVVTDGAWRADPVAPSPLSPRVLAGPGDGNIARLRNIGWRAARGRLVAFTDDDCRPSPRWLTTLLREHGADAEAVLQGRTEPDPSEIHLLHGFARSQRIAGPSVWCETCNAAYPRSLLERLGGFDERFAQIGEDSDLACRAIGAGSRQRYVEDAVVWHGVLARSLVGALRGAVGRRDAAAVVGRHPRLRAGLFMGHFWNRGHAALALGLVTLASARRRRSLLLAGWLPYAEYRLNWREPVARRLARGLLGLPAHALVDLVAMLARLPAAARQRVLVL